MYFYINMHFNYKHKKLKDYCVNKEVCLYYREMLFFPLNIEEKIAISILGEEIELRWSRFSPIIAYKGKYRGRLEMLLEVCSNHHPCLAFPCRFLVACLTSSVVCLIFDFVSHG